MRTNTEQGKGGGHEALLSCQANGVLIVFFSVEVFDFAEDKF